MNEKQFVEKTVLNDGGTRVNRIAVMCMFKNNEDYLTKFFFEMVLLMEKKYDVMFEYYFIENNSTDRTRELLREFFRTKTDKSRLLLFNVKNDYKNIGDGKNYDRLFHLAKIRNMLVDNVVPLSTDWCLFIDSNIFFKEDILEKCFAYSPTENNIGMMVPYTQQLFIPEIHRIDNLTSPTLLSHFYDTFSFFDVGNKTFWPYCAFEKCKLCKREGCVHRKAIPKEMDVVDVASAFGGFCFIKADIINNKSIRWETLSHEVNKDESVCEHFMFCNMLKKITDKRVVVLQNVDDVYRTY
uniref:Glycosyltransferase n=1 Tax=Pyramimonas orientalis virus TaxID=455367 RepID=A0A7M3UP17_POV01|nr:hypothetical protein HWQ62_00336 [Pyramimonas orientalis virus]